jgi:UDP-N-acetylmuramyl pentapeptide phosphotransferase/UDP-N-acetylglucosamine-1-phosphate transferase
VSLFSTFALVNLPFNSLLLDSPNERSLHHKPVPRSGGISIFMSVLAGIIFLVNENYISHYNLHVIIAFILVILISFFDDLYGLPAISRILVHFTSAGTLYLSGLYPDLGLLGSVIIFVAIVWAINLYNFMDGMDGFASGMTLIGFTFLGMAGYFSGEELYMMICFIIAAASLGFLVFNFPLASIFMGDTGAATLGLAVVVMSLWGVKLGIFEYLVPIIIFSIFIVDSTITLIKRLLRGDKVWEAHREHYYQRFAIKYANQRNVLFVTYFIMLITGSSGLLYLYNSDWMINVFFIWVMVYVISMLVSELFLLKNNKTNN